MYSGKKPTAEREEYASVLGQKSVAHRRVGVFQA